MVIRDGIRAAGAILLAGALLACASRPSKPSRPGESGAPNGHNGLDSCAFVAYYEGNAYVGVGVSVAPVEGEPVGTAVLPGCDDTDGQDRSPPDEVIQVAALPGVPPDVALVWHEVTHTVLVREGVGFPPEVQALVGAPSCDPADVPIELKGPWLGIVDGDQTEADLLPPYQVDMQVLHASAPRYERAFLTIEVPVDLGRPLSHEDVETSLWAGGSISVKARCAGDGYVAESLEASPPA
jgi:hypothetical protein